MDSNTIIGLVISGFVLICLEVFIPGGIIGLLGLLLVLAAIVSGFATQGAAWGAKLLLFSLIGGIAGFWLWIKYFPKSPMGKKFILDKTAKDWKASKTQDDLVGKRGITHTQLRPSGTAIIGGKRIDVVTRGEMIANETKIKVIQVEGYRVVVTTDNEETNTDSEK